LNPGILGPLNPQDHSNPVRDDPCFFKAKRGIVTGSIATAKEVMDMAKMTERMKDLFNSVPTVVLSTSTVDGTPNAVPVSAKKIIDSETVLISDQFFNKTLANMKANHRVSVTYWEGHEGY
jgi:predicted pyridoxine 5'-phosphate oxidase superfamily flavin-nucleotide-binding protein